MICRAAKVACPTNPAAVLTALVSTQFTRITSGRVEISIQSDASGGSTSFQIPPGMDPLQLATLAESALEWLLNQPDPVNPVFDPPATRIQFGFTKARPY